MNFIPLLITLNVFLDCLNIHVELNPKIYKVIIPFMEFDNT